MILAVTKDWDTLVCLCEDCSKNDLESPNLSITAKRSLRKTIVSSTQCLELRPIHESDVDARELVVIMSPARTMYNGQREISVFYPMTSCYGWTHFNNLEIIV